VWKVEGRGGAGGRERRGNEYNVGRGKVGGEGGERENGQVKSEEGRRGQTSRE